MKEYTLAIINDPAYGMRDFRNDKPGLWFSVSWGSYGALITLQGEELETMLRENKVYDIKELHHKPCYLDIGEEWGDPVRFVRLASELLK